MIAECGCKNPFILQKDPLSSQGDCNRNDKQSLTYLIEPPTQEANNNLYPKYPMINESYHLKMAQLVLSQFDLLIPMKYLSHPLLTRYVLYKLNWLYPCNHIINITKKTSNIISTTSSTIDEIENGIKKLKNNIKKDEVVENEVKKETFELLTHPNIEFQHLHKTVNEAYKYRIRDKANHMKLTKDEEIKHHNLYLNKPIPTCIEKEMIYQNKLDSLLYQWSLEKFKIEIEEFATLGNEITCIEP